MREVGKNRRIMFRDVLVDQPVSIRNVRDVNVIVYSWQAFYKKHDGFKCCFEWQYTFRFIPLTYTRYSLCVARSFYYSGARRRNIVFVWKRSSWHWNIVNVPIYEFLYPLSFHLYASELHCNSLALILKYRPFLKLRSTCNAFFRDKFKY